MRIFAYNPSLEGIEKTFLSNDTTASATVFPVKNTNNFTNGQKVLIGEMSRERSEIRTIQSGPAIDSLTLDAASFPHDADDPIYALKWNQIKVYRSTTGENGIFSNIATISVDVDNADGKTWYNDPNSLDTYWYKVSYYDSVAVEESDQSPAVQATGYSRQQIGSVIADVARENGDPDFLIMDQATYISNANDISEDLRTRAKRPYRFQKKSMALDLGAAASTIPFPDDLWSINYLEVNNSTPSVSSVVRPKKVSATRARYDLARSTLGGDYVREVAYDDEANELIVVPKSLLARTGAFTLHYYSDFTEFDNFASTIFKQTRRVYKLGLKRDFYLTKADSSAKYFTKAQNYDKMYEVEIAKLQRTKNIEAGGPMSMGPDRKNYIQWGGPRYQQ